MDVLHAAGTAPGVAVVEFESFALEDECAEAILRWGERVNVWKGLWNRTG